VTIDSHLHVGDSPMSGVQLDPDGLADLLRADGYHPNDPAVRPNVHLETSEASVRAVPHDNAERLFFG
jgi:hypothetical protein